MTDSDVAPTVLLVDSNPMNVLRLTELLQGRGFEVSVCEDGDEAVDEYIRLDPELVVLALDLPSLDGHLAALEMREHGGDERILFVAPRRMLSLAKDAGYSAGAVAVLEKPVTRSALDAVWSAVEGPVPEAPGLEDLEELYPDRSPPALELQLPDLPLPPLPALNEGGELPPLPALPALDVVVEEAPPKRRKWGRRLLLLVLLGAAGGAGYAYQTGMLVI
ncbi:MAG TPA: response regulator [Candidatus Poseidoniaceae archaeon]|nr:MAG: response regulator [Euryarchaeota archaeon TMED141]DAC09585.1 MAG TPA: response regulator [Candidatus Poseidoniales archaeon]DAC19240.1 MAG TPA: response regulator [Candidatus Poseidoniales archaeon]HII18805.1 response regulator [Candidatus Poseidoniaceae archaeon]HII96102.1 response regulator [Candidatus Poseidoniaceae archaeon]|tara:strand:- start:941 stop:1600 length:660 start_codon:yes stop_codon:yes gene_type:complete